MSSHWRLIQRSSRSRRLNVGESATEPYVYGLWRAGGETMDWEFEMVAGPFNPRLTEGPAWDGTALLFTHIPANRIIRYAPQTGQSTVFREGTNHTNGLAFDSEGH